MSPDQGGAIDYCIKNIKRGIRKRKSMEGDDHQEKTSKAASSTTESPTAVQSTTSSETQFWPSHHSHRQKYHPHQHLMSLLSQKLPLQKKYWPEVILLSESFISIIAVLDSNTDMTVFLPQLTAHWKKILFIPI